MLVVHITEYVCNFFAISSIRARIMEKKGFFQVRDLVSEHKYRLSFGTGISTLKILTLNTCHIFAYDLQVKGYLLYI